VLESLVISITQIKEWPSFVGVASLRGWPSLDSPICVIGSHIKRYLYYDCNCSLTYTDSEMNVCADWFTKHDVSSIQAVVILHSCLIQLFLLDAMGVNFLRAFVCLSIKNNFSNLRSLWISRARGKNGDGLVLAWLCRVAQIFCSAALLLKIIVQSALHLKLLSYLSYFSFSPYMTPSEMAPSSFRMVLSQLEPSY